MGGPGGKIFGPRSWCTDRAQRGPCSMTPCASCASMICMAMNTCVGLSMAVYTCVGLCMAMKTLAGLCMVM